MQEKSTSKLVFFEDKKIRRIFYKGEWYFSVVDVVEVLAETSNPRRYWSLDVPLFLAQRGIFDKARSKRSSPNEESHSE